MARLGLEEGLQGRPDDFLEKVSLSKAPEVSRHTTQTHHARITARTKALV